MMKKVFSTILISFFALSLFGCTNPSSSVESTTTTTTSSSSTSDVIKVGVFEPITGAYAAGGQAEKNGIELANKLNPTVLGKTVQLVIADNKSDKVEAAVAASKLVEQDKVTAILGSWSSSLCMAAGDIVKNAKTPAIAASATNPLVTEGNDYYFRVCFIDSFQGTVMANYAYNELGARNIAILESISSDYSVGLADFFKQQFTKLGGTIVDTQSYNTGDTDFSAQLQNMKSKNPDAIFAPGDYTESAMAIKQARDLGIQTQFLGGDTYEIPAFLEVGGSAVEGVVFSSFFDPSNPLNEEAKKFVDEYQKAYGEAPPSDAANGYDAYLVLLDAITRAGSTDPVMVRDAIAATNGFVGATGVTTLNATGDAVKDAVLKVVKDGEFVFKGVAKAE